jgi:hypothetical protein
MDTPSLFPEYKPKKDRSEWPIAGGAFMMVGSLFAFYIVISLFLSVSAYGFERFRTDILVFISIFLTAMVLLATGSMIGGVAAMRRKPYSYAVAGGVCSILCSTVFGLVGLILVIKSKSEFLDSDWKNQEVLMTPRKRPL